MDIKANINWIKNELNDVKDPTLIQALKNMLTYRKNIQKASNYISLEQYNKELEVAEKDIENGDYFTTEEARKIANQWKK